MDNADGVYSDIAETALIGESTKGKRLSIPVIKHVTRHEMGHAMDHALGNQLRKDSISIESDSPFFTDIDPVDFRIENAMRLDFHADTDSGIKAILHHAFSNPQEAFADNYAVLLNLGDRQGAVPNKNDMFTLVFPNTLNAVRDILDEEGLSIP